MRIGEAVIELSFSERSLETLGSRLRRDYDKGRPLTHILEQMERTANRMRDLEIALDWTYQNVMVSNLPLGSYISKSKHLEKLAKMLENVDSPDLREKIDELYEAKKQLDRVVQTVYWAYDLVLPDVEAKQSRPEEED